MCPLNLTPPAGTRVRTANDVNLNGGPTAREGRTHMDRRRLLVRSCAVFLLLGLCTAGAAQAREIRIAAASDLKFALDETIAEFRKANTDANVKVSYGSSGNFYSQISQGAPYDVFLSADEFYPRRLVEAGHAMADSKFSYAVGRLVIWAGTNGPVNPTELGIAALSHESVRKIAIANPEHAPYGRAAVAAMRKLGVYEAIKDRLVYGENIAQAAQFVDTGAADVGLIALGFALAPAMKEKGRYWEVPMNAYPRLEQAGVILSRVNDRALAERFRGFMVGEHGKSILRRYGFFMPNE